MGSKTISISDETYHRLADHKGPEESFSDVINRLLRVDNADHPLMGLYGLLSEEEVERVRERSQAFRSSVDDRMDPGE